MGGIAITIPNANFGNAFGNTITDLVDTPVTKISIFANDYLIGTQYQLSALYEPTKTNQRGVLWTIVSGSEYAAIDSTSGILTIFETANSTPVVVRATSTWDASVFDTKQITLTYKRAAIPERTVKTIGKLSNVNDEADLPAIGRKMLVKENNSENWTLSSAPPTMVVDKTEEEVMEMIENGTIDENTLYFCEE